MDKKPGSPSKFRLKIFGIGGAGANIVSHIAAARENGPHALAGVELVAVHTDYAALESVAAADRIPIGSTVTHGLSTGGDPEQGQRAAQQDNERLEAALQNTEIVFLCAGLGGGTGGGASPVVARLARDQGALVLALVVTPFHFEA